MSIENLKGFGETTLEIGRWPRWPLSNVECFFLVSDPFADAAKGDEESVQDGLVHIRIQQRNGRKTLTTIQGLSAEYDLKKIVRACKKVSEFIQIMK